MATLKVNLDTKQALRNARTLQAALADLREPIPAATKKWRFGVLFLMWLWPHYYVGLEYWEGVAMGLGAIVFAAFFSGWPSFGSKQAPREAARVKREYTRPPYRPAGTHVSNPPSPPDAKPDPPPPKEPEFSVLHTRHFDPEKRQ